METRYICSTRGDWQRALRPMPTNPNGGTDRGISLYPVSPGASGMGAAPRATSADAKAEIEEMKGLRTGAATRRSVLLGPIAPRSRMLAISALDRGEGRCARSGRCGFMRAAAGRRGWEPSKKRDHGETALYPLREMLAELLLEVGPARGGAEGI